MNILGVVPARGGSKGVPGKNLLTLGGRSLLWLAIESALKSTLLSRVVLSTEDDELAREGLAAGAEVPFSRPLELASDTAGTWDVMRHAVRWLEDHEGCRVDLVVVLQPTTPFRTSQHIDEVIDRVLETGCEACISVRPVDYPPHWMLRRSTDGSVSRLLSGGESIVRRQDAPAVHQPNGLVYAVRRTCLERKEVLPKQGLQSVVMDFEDSINIDEWWHYRLAEVVWSRRFGSDVGQVLA